MTHTGARPNRSCSPAISSRSCSPATTNFHVTVSSEASASITGGRILRARATPDPPSLTLTLKRTNGRFRLAAGRIVPLVSISARHPAWPAAPISGTIAACWMRGSPPVITSRPAPVAAVSCHTRAALIHRSSASRSNRPLSHV
jgi:hypothetical protein